MKGIKGYETFVTITPIKKGWSDDRKYYIETTDGRRMFLRVSDISDYDIKKSSYDMMKQAYILGVHTSEPIFFRFMRRRKQLLFVVRLD